MKRKGISPVIATVMIMMITVAAAALIMGFVLPFINEQTEGASECFDVFQGVEFGSTAYNCYLDSSMTCGGSACNERTAFSVRVMKEGVVGLKISLTGVGSSDSYEINGTISPGDNFRMLDDGTYGDILSFPEVGGMRTYVVTKNYESIKVAPILENDKICDVMDSVVLDACIGEAVNLVNP